MRTCSVEGCDRKHDAKGLCKSHYTLKWQKEHPDQFKKTSQALDKKYRADPAKRSAMQARTKDWRNRNKEHCYEYSKAYSKNNKNYILSKKNEHNRRKVDKLYDSYIRQVFKLPPGTNGDAIDSGRSLILNVRRMKNERP